VTRNTARHDDEAFAELRAHFDDREIVELTLITAHFNLMNRFNDALQIDLEEPAQLGAMRSLRVDPEAMREYIDTVTRWERIP
jgi:hypothetical protein